MPLTKEQQAEIKVNLEKATKSLKDGKADIQTAKKAGIDVADQETQIKELELKLRKMQAVYG